MEQHSSDQHRHTDPPPSGGQQAQACMNAGLEQLRAIGNRLLNDLSRLSKSDLNIVTMIGLIAVVAILLPVVFTVIGVLTVASAACHPERERSQTRTQESPPEPNHHEDHTITPERMDHA